MKGASMPGFEARVTAEFDIRHVLNRYCTAIDRRDFELVRSCYHPEATDDHHVFNGSADDFVDFAISFVGQFTHTFHFLGNTLVDVIDDDHARSESYVVAYHRLAGRDERAERDHVVGARYVDAFERRNGGWRIAARVVTLEWTRTDPVQPGWSIPERP